MGGRFIVFVIVAAIGWILWVKFRKFTLNRAKHGTGDYVEGSGSENGIKLEKDRQSGKYRPVQSNGSDDGS